MLQLVQATQLLQSMLPFVGANAHIDIESNVAITTLEKAMTINQHRAIDEPIVFVASVVVDRCSKLYLSSNAAAADIRSLVIHLTNDVVLMV